jgi:hypothetical protein
MVDQNIQIGYWRNMEEWKRRTSSQPSYSSWKRKGWDYLLARKSGTTLTNDREFLILYGDGRWSHSVWYWRSVQKGVSTPYYDFNSVSYLSSISNVQLISVLASASSILPRQRYAMLPKQRYAMQLRKGIINRDEAKVVRQASKVAAR